MKTIYVFGHCKLISTVRPRCANDIRNRSPMNNSTHVTLCWYDQMTDSLPRGITLPCHLLLVTPTSQYLALPLPYPAACLQYSHPITVHSLAVFCSCFSFPFSIRSVIHHHCTIYSHRRS